MAKINFIVRRKVEGQPATVYVRYSDKRGIDFSAATREKIFPEYWSYETQEFKQRIIYSDAFTEEQKIEIENRFTEIKSFINKEYFRLKGGQVSASWLRASVDKYYGKAVVGSENLSQYVERFITEAKDGKRKATIKTKGKRIKRQYSWHSLRSMRGFMLSLKKFSEATGKQYDWNDINIDWYDDFVQFFNDRNCSPNYIGKHIQVLKAIMRQAREEGLHSNTEIDRKAFVTLSEDVESIALTEEEVQALFDLDLSDNEPYQIYRDVFLAGVYTAQRYGDYSKINKTNIKVIKDKKTGEMKRFIKLVQSKTGQTVTIPILPALEIILKRYNYTLPPTQQQKLNDAIKKIGEKAGITEIINVEKTKGGLKDKTSVKKCDLICSHTARRTGCSLMISAEIPIFGVMHISGHKTYDEFKKYVRLDEDAIAIELSNDPYYSGKLKVV